MRCDLFKIKIHFIETSSLILAVNKEDCVFIVEVVMLFNMNLDLIEARE
jgi:hypothetical protein